MTREVKKILVLAANPKDTPRLRLDEEVREIDAGLQRSQRRDEFELKQVWAVRLRDLRRAMLDFRPNIVHFSGHGAKNGIVFEDEQGLSKPLEGQALSGFFGLFADVVECVILNACYSEEQAVAIGTHIPYVIGMKKEIGDKAAIEFAVAFYDALGAGESIEFAYKLACNAIRLSGVAEHSVPVMHRSAKNVSGGNTGSPLNILVTGGKKASPRILNLSFLIGQQVILRGHTLFSNGALGVDKAAAEGALSICQSKSLDASTKIQVFRPRQAPQPSFSFGNLQIVGLDYDERRNFVVQKSDALIVLGGSVGTLHVIRQAQLAQKIIVPIGIGVPNEVAVQFWHKIREDFVGNLPVIPIPEDDLRKVGPGESDMRKVAVNAVLVVEKMVRRKKK